ncbi:sigma-54 dependent transcriptional regulator [Paraflavisolibacter sp. H34]|uniref:sigma-54-dependent transcriptional regulator n=1 Tax=Huijunlia imazamoxiresistens TaxID=3127457 RepID=UPI0030166351
MQLKNAVVLVIDDDPDVLTSLRLLLKTQVGDLHIEKNPERIPGLLHSEHFDLVLLDMNYKSAVTNGNEGFFWLRRIRELRPGTGVIMITAYGEIELAVRALKEGALDFVVKPWYNDKLLATLREALSRKSGAAAGAPAVKKAESDLIGTSEGMQEVFYKISKIAPTEANILVLGENGTGKDLVAKTIHRQSLRAQAPFVKVDVGALSETLFESELFGHKKGAFTDAREERVGRFEAAGGGTLFLDEIGNISLPLQAKLLTVLQNRQVTPLGSNHPRPVDIRLLCATNVPLRELANESRFRKDLVYRINTVEITVPPLRERGEDILLLARHFSELYARKYHKPLFELDAGAADKLLRYSYPGNVRELQYTIERAVILAEGSLLQAKDILFSPLEAEFARPQLSETNLGLLERNAILRAIEKNKGNITQAARELGLTRTALYRRLDKYDI